MKLEVVVFPVSDGHLAGGSYLLCKLPCPEVTLNANLLPQSRQEMRHARLFAVRHRPHQAGPLDDHLPQPADQHVRSHDAASPRAQAHAEASQNIAHRVGAKRVVGCSLLVKARIALARGDKLLARTHAEEAGRMFEACRANWYLREAQDYIDEVQTEDG